MKDRQVDRGTKSLEVDENSVGEKGCSEKGEFTQKTLTY